MNDKYPAIVCLLAGATMLAESLAKEPPPLYIACAFLVAAFLLFLRGLFLKDGGE